MQWRFVALLASLLLVGAACGDAADGVADEPAATVAAAESTATVSAADVEACGLLTADEIAARGRTVTAGPEPDQSAAPGSTCYFYVGDVNRPDCGCTSVPGYVEGQITLTIRPSDDGFQAVKAASEGDAGALDAAEALDGLGVEAYYRAGRGAVDVLLDDGRHFELSAAEVERFGTPEFHNDLVAWARLAVGRL